MGSHRERHQLAVRARGVLVALALLAAAGLALCALAVRVSSPAPGARVVAGDDTAAAPEGSGGSPGVADQLPEGVPDEVAEVLGSAAGEGGARGWSSELPLQDEARRVLEEADGSDDCVLARAGYLDLAGRTWGCVTQGSGWAEVCLVWERADGSGSEVRVWRLDASELARGRDGG